MQPAPDPADERTLAALDSNYLASYCGLMGSSQAGEYAERRDVALVSCGAPLARFNIAHLKRPLDAPSAALDFAADFFGRRRLPYCIELRAGGEAAQARLEEALRSAGFERTQAPVPGMALLPSTTKSPPPPSELTIERVADEAARASFVRTAAVGFGFPEHAGSAIFSRAFLERPGTQAFLGRLDGDPVATSMLYQTGAVAGIYWVATLPDARRRGFGEALTWAAVSAGIEVGCRIASLQASAMGRPVYARMGFAHVLDYVRYERPDRPA